MLAPAEASFWKELSPLDLQSLTLISRTTLYHLSPQTVGKEVAKATEVGVLITCPGQPGITGLQEAKGKVQALLCVFQVLAAENKNFQNPVPSLTSKGFSEQSISASKELHMPSARALSRSVLTVCGMTPSPVHHVVCVELGTAPHFFPGLPLPTTHPAFTQSKPLFSRIDSRTPCVYACSDLSGCDL